MSHNMMQAARDYSSRGWSIIPIRPGTKKPAVDSWKPYQTHHADEDEYGIWYGNGQANGIAVVLGAVSGNLVCRDFDKMRAYKDWKADHPELAATLPTVKTGRGRHVYFRADVDLIRQASKSGGGSIVFDDGELRADAHYCVLPPSKHPNGGQYEWLHPVGDDVPFVDLLEAGFLDSGGCPIEDRETLDAERAETTERAESPERTENCLPGTALSTTTMGHAIERAIQRSQPLTFGKRHQQVFKFARELKGIPGLTDAKPKDLKPYVRRWFEIAKDFITTPFEETWFDFAEGWNNVKFPAGKGPVDMAFAKIQESAFPPAAENYEQENLRCLVALCRELQRAVGANQPFFLACRTGADLLGVDHTTVSRWLRGLQADEIIKLAEAGCREKRLANRYRYIAEDL